jgi:hypothetical protein
MKRLLLSILLTTTMYAQTPERKLTILLTSDRQIYKVGDGVLLSVELRNAGSEPITIYKDLLWGYRGGLLLDIRDASDKKVEAEQLDDDSVIPDRLKDSQSFIELPPDYKWGVVRRDNASNLFRKPGRYTIRAGYVSPVPRKHFIGSNKNSWATEDGSIWSAPISIEIQ